MEDTVTILQTGRIVYANSIREKVMALDEFLRSRMSLLDCGPMTFRVPDGEVILKGSVTQIVGSNYAAIAQGDNVILTGDNHALLRTCAAIHAMDDLGT